MARRAVAWSSLLLAAACSSPPPADDAGSDFDAISTFLLPGMESYRFERVGGKAGYLWVECGRHFRPAGLGYGESEGVSVTDSAGALDAALRECPIAAHLRGVAVREVTSQESRASPVVTTWGAFVDERFWVVATSLELLDRALARVGDRSALVAALRLPMEPTWRSPLTVVRRFDAEAAADRTNPWAARRAITAGTVDPEVIAKDVAAGIATVAIDGVVAEGSLEDSTFDVTCTTSTPAEAEAWLRWLFGLSESSTALQPRERGARTARYAVRVPGHGRLVPDFLFGHNVMP